MDYAEYAFARESDPECHGGRGASRKYRISTEYGEIPERPEVW